MKFDVVKENDHFFALMEKDGVEVAIASTDPIHKEKYGVPLMKKEWFGSTNFYVHSI